MLTCKYDSTALDPKRCKAQVQDFSVKKNTCFFRQCRNPKTNNPDGFGYLHHNMSSKGIPITNYIPANPSDVDAGVFEDKSSADDFYDVFTSVNSRMRENLVLFLGNVKNARNVLMNNMDVLQKKINMCQNDILDMQSEIKSIELKGFFKGKLSTARSTLLSQKNLELKTKQELVSELNEQLGQLELEKNELIEALKEVSVLRTRNTALSAEISDLKERTNTLEEDKLALTSSIKDQKMQFDSEMEALKVEQRKVSEEFQKQVQELQDLDEGQKSKIEEAKVQLVQSQKIYDKLKSEIADLAETHKVTLEKEVKNYRDISEELSLVKTQLTEKEEKYTSLDSQCRESWKILATTTDDILRSSLKDGGVKLEEKTVKVEPRVLRKKSSFSFAKFGEGKIQESDEEVAKTNALIRESGAAQTLIRLRTMPSGVTDDKANKFSYEQGASLKDYKRPVTFTYDIKKNITEVKTVLVGGEVWDDSQMSDIDPSKVNKNLFGKYIQDNIRSYLKAKKNTFTLMAYGQSGSGKTYTMDAMMKLTMQQLFIMSSAWCPNNGRSRRRVQVSMKEYYYSYPNGRDIDFKGSTTVEYEQSNYLEFFTTLDNLRTNILKVVATPFNPQSSRSHLVISMRVCPLATETTDIITPSIVFIDLAGSEDLSNMTVPIFKSVIKTKEQLERMKLTYDGVRDLDKVQKLKDLDITLAKRILEKVKSESVYINKSLKEISEKVAKTIKNRSSGGTSTRKGKGKDRTFIESLQARLKNKSSAFQVIVTMSPVPEDAYLETTQSSAQFLNNLAESLL